MPISLFSSLHQLLDKRFHNLRPLRRQTVLHWRFFPQLWTHKGFKKKFLLWVQSFSFFVLNQCLKVDSVFLGTCGEACILACSLWNNQRHLSVDPPLHRSDHVTLGALQQSVKLRQRQCTFQGNKVFLWWQKIIFRAVSMCAVPARLSHQPLKLQEGAGETGCQKLRPHSHALYPFVEPELSYWGKRFQLCNISTSNLYMGLKMTILC